VSPVNYELCFYIPEDDILHSHRRDNLKSYNISSDASCLLGLLFDPEDGGVLPKRFRVCNIAVCLPVGDLTVRI
jgi:hypothetical protein